MRKSIFSEYFYLCAAIISASIICIGAVLLVVSAEFYKNDKKTYLVNATSEMLAVTSISIESGEVDTNYLKNVYLNTTETSEIDFTLVNQGGDVLVCSEAPPCFHAEKRLGETILANTTENGYYSLGTLEDYYDKSYFNLGYKLDSGYYLFAKMSTDSLNSYLTKLVLMLGTVAVCFLILVFVVIYVATKRLMYPIREMTIAARRFGDGDFSEKLYITEQNELGFLANSLNEMASSLEEIEESRKSFVSNVSHELKTPMTTIGGFIDGILDGTIPPEMHRHYLRIVADEVARLARLVRSMLNISKYEAGELELSKEVFDMMPLVIRTMLNFEKRIDERKLEIIGLDYPNFKIKADADLMQQVMYNLIENAVKFANENGFIQLIFEQNEDSSTIKIRNSGQGLKSNEISKVFERFYKADESRGIDKTGVGLGLSIVSSIIKLHDGTILVRSEPNQYVEFEVTLNN